MDEFEVVMTATATDANRKYQNAAEWLRDLGDVPLERIIFDPPPRTATEADLIRRVEVDKQLCELVEGTLVEKPMGYYESMVAARILYLLMGFVDKHDLGAVSGEASMHRLKKGLVRLPDVAFVRAERLRGRDPREAILGLSPDLAVEVLSESNTRSEIERKLSEYFAAGTRLVWVIDPATRSARSYTDPNSPAIVDLDGVLHGGDIVPGFSLSLRELFDYVDKKFQAKH
jgi:Uma2 family endonuclease